MKPFGTKPLPVSKSNSILSNTMSEQQPPSVFDHVKGVVHEEEVGDNWRTARSGVQTKLGDVRAHDRGQQAQARKITHHAQTVGRPNSVKEVLDAEHKIEHIHEHRTLLSGFTL